MIWNIPSLRGLSCSELLEKSYHHSSPCRYGSPGEVIIPNKGSSHKRVTKLFATESLDSSSYPTLLLKINQISQCVISGIKPEKVRDLVFRGIWDMFHPFWIRSHVFRIQHKRDFQGLWNQQKFLSTSNSSWFSASSGLLTSSSLCPLSLSLYLCYFAV